MSDVSSNDDMIDVRDVIARVEELREECAALEEAIVDSEPEERTAAEAALSEWRDDYAPELKLLESLLDDLKGYGGDEQWESDWYPGALIRDSYFQEYAEQLADDIGAINAEAGWPNNCIDWERAARELQVDYSTVEFEGATYWYR